MSARVRGVASSVGSQAIGEVVVTDRMEMGVLLVSLTVDFFVVFAARGSGPIRACVMCFRARGCWSY